MQRLSYWAKKYNLAWALVRRYRWQFLALAALTGLPTVWTAFQPGTVPTTTWGVIEWVELVAALLVCLAWVALLVDLLLNLRFRVGGMPRPTKADRWTTYRAWGRHGLEWSGLALVAALAASLLGLLPFLRGPVTLVLWSNALVVLLTWPYTWTFLATALQDSDRWDADDRRRWSTGLARRTWPLTLVLALLFLGSQVDWPGRWACGLADGFVFAAAALMFARHARRHPDWHP